MGDAPEVPKCQAPLTNNAQIRVAPGESTSISKADRALELVSTVWLRFGFAVSALSGPGSSAEQGGPTRNTVLTGPLCFKTLQGDPNLAHTRFQMVKQLGPPLDCLELGR